MDKAPFETNDRVDVIRSGNLGSYPARVVKCQRDRFGFDVLVNPDDPAMDLRWVPSTQLVKINA